MPDRMLKYKEKININLSVSTSFSIFLISSFLGSNPSALMATWIQSDILTKSRKVL